MIFKRWLRLVVTCACYYSGLSWIWFMIYARKGVRVLTYHEIIDDPNDSYRVNARLLEEHLLYLKRRFDVISMDEIRACFQNKRPFPRNAVLITFDDGYMSFYERVRPLLKKYGIPAATFIISDETESDNARHMHRNELRQLIADRLFEIGSHSATHRSFGRLNDAEIEEELVDSKRRLEALVEGRVESFAYPYGTRKDWDRRCAGILRKSGFSLAFTSVNGINLSWTNRYALRRTKIEGHDDLRQFKRILYGALDIWVIVDLIFPFLQKKAILPS